MPSTVFVETNIPGLGRFIGPQTTFSGDELVAIARRERETVQRNNAIIEQHIARIHATAIRSSILATKSRARAFLRIPAKLNVLSWGLAHQEPAEGLRIVERLYRSEPKVAQIPVNTSLLNLDAARIAFRFLRRRERADDRAAMLASE